MDLTNHAGFFLEYYEDEIDLDLEVNPSKRLLRDLEDVIYDRDWFSKLNEKELNKPVYLMFRNIARPGTKGTFNGRQVRVDITIIPARSIGTEPIKTLGHFHPLSDLGKPFPEIYQVLWGKGMFIEFAPQIKDEQLNFKKIERVNTWKVKTDNFVVLEAGGHVLVNLSKTRPLITLNLVYSRFNSIYDPVLEMKGAPYYYTNIDGELQFVKNKNYSKVPKITEMELPEAIGPLKQGRPIYKGFLNDPKFFNFLVGKLDKKKEKQGKGQTPNTTQIQSPVLPNTTQIKPF